MNCFGKGAIMNFEESFFKKNKDFFIIFFLFAIFASIYNDDLFIY